MEMVQLNKMCVIRGKHVRNQKCVRRPIITQTVAANKTYVICSVYTTSIGHKDAKRHPISARTSCSISSSSKRTLKLTVLRLEQPSDG